MWLPETRRCRCCHWSPAMEGAPNEEWLPSRFACACDRSLEGPEAQGTRPARPKWGHAHMFQSALFGRYLSRVQQVAGPGRRTAACVAFVGHIRVAGSQQETRPESAAVEMKPPTLTRHTPNQLFDSCPRRDTTRPGLVGWLQTPGEVSSLARLQPTKLFSMARPKAGHTAKRFPFLEEDSKNCDQNGPEGQFMTASATMCNAGSPSYGEGNMISPQLIKVSMKKKGKEELKN